MVIFMKTRQKSKQEATPSTKKDILSPTTTLQYRGTLGESNVFSRARGMADGLETKENKGAQKGKTPLDVREAFRTGPGNEGGC